MPEAREQIDARIASLADWRGPRLARLRTLIHQAGLLNASLKGDTRRAIELHDEWLDEQAFIAMVLNLGQS
ncbi:hypothetical protein LZ838_22615 [Pseudomonas sp. AA27]|uniref:hypothetical protein n=1 Tax=Pseudomonas sp. AA27 TaxID=2908652 RepID=UPI001F38457D|nr:hypothetical protein [Pseudomonas sp. AA27]MCF1490149.1 hypothetical protein [Pseudomonas sp. AA27]